MNNTARREGLTLTNVNICRKHPITTARFTPKETAGRRAFDFLTQHGPRFNAMGTAANADAPMGEGWTTNMILLEPVDGCEQSWIRIADVMISHGAVKIDPMETAVTAAVSAAWVDRPGTKTA